MPPVDDVDDETHPLVLPEVPIVMPQGALPVVRDGTIGGIPAYEATLMVELKDWRAISPSTCAVIKNIGDCAE